MDAADVARLARADSALTHPSQVCQDSCAAFAVAVAHAIRTGEGAEAAYRAALRWSRKAGAASAVVEALLAAENALPSDFETHMGHVVIALQNAFHEALHAESAEAALVRTVGQGGDTDTNGAIAGALLGAIHGRDAVPLRWRRAVLTCRALAGTSQPRPAEYWPVDLLQLAERLLIAGKAQLD
jgi:ADP-ribosylglycohydrolase